MDKKLERILPLVQKPARYTGGEYGEIQKDKSEVDLRMALCFPDTYEIGMSNTGMRILYQVLNDLPGVWCERVFAPWFDMDRQMREKGLPLYALESGDPLSEFDAIGFSLGYEMAYTTVLEMLDLAGIPLRSAERTSLTPLVFAGGSVCCNSEPMADFFDLMIIGEGESVDGEVLQLLREAKAAGWSKAEFLRRAALIGGVCVGAGLGIVFVAGASTGGVDIVARLLKLRFRNFPIGKIILIMDLCTAVATGLVYGEFTNTLYSAITLYLSSVMVDKVVYSMDYAKVALIISDQYEDIAAAIDGTLDRGVTLLDGHGAWSGRRKDVILCAFGRSLIVPIKKLVREIDPDAFVIVCDAHEILGEGFGTYTPGGL